MEIILPPIKPGESGPPVANLQDALLILVERSVIQPLSVPNRPTAEELKTIVEGVRSERRESHFGASTQSSDRIAVSKRFAECREIRTNAGDGLITP